MGGETRRFKPWPHQKAAVTAACDHLADGGRATVVSACGTGKTGIAAMTADRLARHGRVVVVFPTIELLSQTAQVWSAWAPHTGSVVAVCGESDVLEAAEADLGEVSTSPGVVAALTRSGAVTVLCTYASIPVLAAAHREHGMEAFDLLICDEAHRTAGRLGRRWSGVHDDAVIPARRRLYLTATPKVYDEATGTDPVASMTDESVFGPVVYRLGFGQAIDDDLLADYQVVVPAVTERELAALTDGGAGVRELAAQIATLRAAHRYGLRRVITYHSRVAAARGFAARLPRAAELLPEQQRPQGLWAAWLSGKHPGPARRALLREFRAPDHELAVLSNARVLGEGVDVPAVDAVVLADPKRSMIDTIQAVGRALRTGGRTDKIATIVLPVLIADTDDPDTVLDSAEYATVWRVLRALRAHDDRLDHRLTQLTHRLTHVEGEDDLEGADAQIAPLDWLHIDAVPDAASLALGMLLRVVDAKSAEWRRGYTAVLRFHRAHGHIDVTQAFRDDHGFALGSWLSWQRWLHTRGALSAHRVAALDALGMEWQPRRSRWDRGYRVAARYHRAHGHLAVGVDEDFDDFALGAWLRNQRTRPEYLTAEREAALTQLDPWWNPPWSLTWQRLYITVRAYHREHGTLTMPRTTTYQGAHIGEWLHNQRRKRDSLDPRQIALLDELGMDWTPPDPHGDHWRLGLSKAVAYFDEHQHLRVPQSYRTPDGFALGQWIGRQRRLHVLGKLAEGRREVLDSLGMVWSAPKTRTPSRAEQNA